MLLQKVVDAEKLISQLHQEKEMMKVEQEKRQVDEKLKHIKNLEAKMQKLKDQHRHELLDVNAKHSEAIAAAVEASQK